MTKYTNGAKIWNKIFYNDNDGDDDNVLLMPWVQVSRSAQDYTHGRYDNFVAAYIARKRTHWIMIIDEGGTIQHVQRITLGTAYPSTLVHNYFNSFLFQNLNHINY